MRLDKYLKVSRLIKRRTVANDACDGGKITVNGKVSKASYNVAVGDIIEITFGERKIAVKVESINEYAKKDDASAMYSAISNN
ncbi:MAG: RNA-binding S4 domain-containing protein [Clostridia bacterium]|nr:RNA-binding S4 domain-containing protein [Clostridia bacterium]